ncbi:MAG TPA: response regulator [Pirellulales bacterium]|nr:response regulator [Pirellulales bacterium]
MSAKPKLLYVSSSRDASDERGARFREAFEVVTVHSPIRALAQLARDDFAGIYVDAVHVNQALQIGKLLQNERILQGMPDGVVLLDSDNTILWGNGRLREWTHRENVAGANFYAVLGSPEILGPDFCPFHTALATGAGSSSTLRSSDNHYYRVHAAPLIEDDGPPKNLVVTIRDVTAEVLQQQKLAAIHQAGIELANLTPDELFAMTVEERIELLKSNILHYTRDLLNFNVVEIRLLDSKTGKLEPLLSEGLLAEATNRVLYAQPQNNGVTGFVAATGKSYLCEDTTEDPLYLEGAAGAKSSLTVPLVLHDEVIGTFNVESPEPRAFSESDLQFLEIFTRDVALALNTLELLVAEKASTAAESVEAIHSAVALPVDDILNDAVNIMERYIGHEPEVAERLQRILRNARDIKQVIQKVGQQMAPSQAHPQAMQVSERPHLRGLTVLVADADESVRSAAHNLLERYGCIVETAHDGGEAVFMVRNLSPGQNYDVIIADIRLPDMSGYEFMLKLQGIMEHVPLVLMTGFGYDPGHSIVKARQAGLPAGAVLYKPFRLDQLLETVEQVVRSRAVEQA